MKFLNKLLIPLILVGMLSSCDNLHTSEVSESVSEELSLSDSESTSEPAFDLTPEKVIQTMVKSIFKVDAVLDTNYWYDEEDNLYYTGANFGTSGTPEQVTTYLTTFIPEEFSVTTDATYDSTNDLYFAIAQHDTHKELVIEMLGYAKVGNSLGQVSSYTIAEE